MSPARSKLARLLSFSEQSWRHAMQHNKRTATTFPAQDARIMADHGRVVTERHAQYQDKNFRPANRPNLRAPEIPNLRKPADLHSHVGGNMALGSTNLDQADNLHAMYNDSPQKHLRYGVTAGVVNRDSRVPPVDRGSDAATQRPHVEPHAANLVNQRPQGELPRVVMPFQKGDIPRQQEITPRAEEYNVCKARVHASLWEQEIRKQASEATSAEGTGDSESSDSFSNSRVGKESSGWDPSKTMPEDWETFDPSEGRFYDESPAKEEAMMFDEFEKRRERNRILIASFVKQHLYGRRRPVDGWKYILNNFRLESKGEKNSPLGGRQTTGNDLEKLALRRESDRLRRKV